MSIFNPTTWLMTILSLVVLSSSLGCQKKNKRLSPQERALLGPQMSPVARPNFEIPKEYLPPKATTPSARSVKCAEAYCPPQVGVLVFVLNELTEDGRRAIPRCTGSLIAPDLVLSNGHCDQTQRGQGYFLTQDGQMNRISGVFFKVYTASERSSLVNGEDLASGRPDAALFRLEQPITNIKPLKLAQGSQLEFNQLTAYVSNANLNGGGYLIQAVTCPIRRNEAIWPYNLKENPDVIKGFDCQTRPGNSGAPMFAPGSDEVQAVYLGFGDPEVQRKATMQNIRRPLFKFEDHWTMLATNVRCLNYPGARPNVCTAVTSTETENRFANLQDQNRQGLLSYRFRDAHKYPYEFETKVYALKFNPKASDRQFEVLFEPKCRKSAAPLKEVVFPQEHLVVDFNEWGELVSEVRSRSLSVGRVESQRDSLVRMTVDWQPGFAQMHKTSTVPDPEALHPRRRYGNRFSIDLPLCSR